MDNDVAMEEQEDHFMTLTREGKGRALALRAALASHLNLRYEPALEVAHVAIVRTDLNRALDTIYKLQCFHEECHILDTPEDSLETIRAFLQLQPGFLLDLAYLPS